MRHFFAAASAIAVFSVQPAVAQTAVTSTLPVAQEISAPVASDIVVDFDRAVNPTTVTAASFRVFGRWSGPVGGTLTFENGNQRVRFAPSRSLFAGEWVTVSISSAVESSTGEPLNTGYAWGYWTATAAASLDFELIGTRNIRQSNEGAIVSYGAYAGDLDRDGWSDLLVPNENPNDVRVFLNTGTGSYPTTFSTYGLTGTGRPSPNEGGDFNNDGFIDVAVGGLSDTKVSVLLGDGAGGFSSIVGYDTVNDIRGVCVADYDADGDDDLIVTGRGGSAVGLLTNDGAGAFVAAGTLNGGSAETSCAVGDANNDGIPDVFVGNFSGDTVALLLGDGAGSFAESDAVSIPGSGSGSAWMLAAGDINGDGHVDVASVNANRNTVSIIFGDGAGQMSDPVNYATGQFALAVDLGDIDGDGDLDMAVSNHTDATWHLFENNGSGVFNTPPRVYNAAGRAACAIFHDRDNDGDLDMTGIDEGDDMLFLFETKQGGTSVEPDIVHAGASVSSPYPNPFSRSSAIDVSVTRQQNVRADLFDLLGRHVRTIHDGLIRPDAPVVLDVGGDNLNDGLYFVRVIGETFRETRTITRVGSR